MLSSLFTSRTLYINNINLYFQGSASTAATFQRIDFRPQPTYNPSSNMTRILDVDGPDQDPKLEMGRAGIRENEPFNYIAFSQQLYGESEKPRARAISFV